MIKKIMKRMKMKIIMTIKNGKEYENDNDDQRED